MSSAPRGERAGGRVVCGINGSTGSRRALVEAVRLAASRGDRVCAVAAYQPRSYFWGAWSSLPWAALLPVPGETDIEVGEQEAARVVVDEVLRTLTPDEVVPPVEVVAAPGRTADVLLEQAEGAAALVVGHRDPSDVAPWTGMAALPSVVAMPGSVALECVRRARCPVLVVPRVRDERAVGLEQ